MPKGIAFKIDDSFHQRLRICLIKKNLKLTKLVEQLLKDWVENQEKGELK